MFNLRSLTLAAAFAVAAAGLFSQSAHAIIPLPGSKPTTIAKKFIVRYVCYQTHSRHYNFLQFFQAMQLRDELKQLGFQTQLSSGQGGLVLYYRLPLVKSRFFSSYGPAHSFKYRMSSLGCQTSIQAVSAVPW